MASDPAACLDPEPAVSYAGSLVGVPEEPKFPPRSGLLVDDPLYCRSGVRADALVDAAIHPPEYQYTVTGKVKKKRSPESRPELGVRVTLNGKAVALYKYKGSILAFDATCPHMGGPLELGDIEDIGGSVCVSCPLHGFTFAVDSGVCVVPERDLCLPTYPVRIEDDGTVSVGFAKLEKTVFEDDDF